MFGKNGGRFDGAITPSIKRKDYIWNYNALGLNKRDWNEHLSKIHVANSKKIITSFKGASGGYYTSCETDIKTGKATRFFLDDAVSGSGIICKSKKDDDIQYVVQSNNYLTTFDMNNYTQNKLLNPPSGIRGACVMAFDYGEGSNIYNFIIDDGNCVNCFLYDKVNNAWIPKAKSLTNSIMIYGGFVCAIEDGFLIFGASSSYNNPNDVLYVYKYTISTDTYSLVTYSKLNYLPPSGYGNYTYTKNTFLNGDVVTFVCFGCSFQFNKKTLEFYNSEYCWITGSIHAYDRIFTVTNAHLDGLGEITFIK